MSTAKSMRTLLGATPSTASVNDSTLIIIDAQNEYADGLLTTRNLESTRPAIRSVLDKYRSDENKHQGKNIVHVQHIGGSAPIFTQDTPLFDEFEELRPASDSDEKIITKNYPSSFAGTDLEDYLKTLGDAGKKVVLTGYMAHVCVSTTARKASELGLEVVIVGDAVGDRDIPGITGEDLTKTALKELDDAFGTVLKSNDIQVA
ncbi:hypothetical protein CI109_101333 [Kwoniella shandongensis]|uniref:Uncharacterized protein n=1 Tax=Kwoniella shandongensis TaxID=1734106 RepID=A0A5M6BWM0_9TREE|nr:uncharacterized protein CI109_005288 [Kwoniella shandongensis]KAA5526332.1 hypothetical protein CI109_005288 [Kwoniella shandongensis]